MKNPAIHRGLRKGLRTALQLAAGGALTALVTAVAGTMAPATAAVVLGAWTVVVATAQNWAETSGRVPVLLPTPGLVPSAAPLAEKAVGTVDTMVERVGQALGEVTGTVTDIGGELIGEVTGTEEG